MLHADVSYAQSCERLVKGESWIEPPRPPRPSVVIRNQPTFVFSTGDVQIIREYYAPRYRRLPPGLQKKYARTGTLPPGWQKKVEPFPVAIERRLIVLPAGYHRGVIDRQAVIYNPRGVIIDVMMIF
jgi:hypothetical protein